MNKKEQFDEFNSYLAKVEFNQNYNDILTNKTTNDIFDNFADRVNETLHNLVLKDKTPLIYACTNNYVHVVKFLIKKAKVDVNKPNSEGVTPLMVAAAYKNIRITRILYKRGAKVLQTDNIGRHSLDYANEYGNLLIYDYLFFKYRDRFKLVTLKWGFGISVIYTIMWALLLRPEFIVNFLLVTITNTALLIYSIRTALYRWSGKKHIKNYKSYRKVSLISKIKQLYSNIVN